MLLLVALLAVLQVCGVTGQAEVEDGRRCSGSQFAAMANGTQVCLPLTECNKTLGELERVAPTAISDRVCTCRAWASWTAFELAWRTCAVMFTFFGIAVLCDEYFTPALEELSEAWDLSDDVAGATFMAAGSSAPELFTSIAAVFAPVPTCGEDRDSVGVGTVVGSAVFNILVIIGLSALLAGQVMALHWKPFVRDICFYSAAIASLYYALSDGTVWWYEALAMFMLYLLYITFMVFNARLLGEYDTLEVEEQGTSNPESDRVALTGSHDDAELGDLSSSAGDVGEQDSELCESWLCIPLVRPWQVLFNYTVPDVRKERWKSWYMAAFFCSIFWIAVLCFFMVMWGIDIAEMIQMSPTVMAFTVLAGGTSVPDCLASIIEARKGKADMAVSNALGSNIFDILFGLSVPYMMVNLKNSISGDVVPVIMCVADLQVMLFTLVVTLAATFALLASSRFRLNKITGVILLVLYLVVVLLGLLRDQKILTIGGTCAPGRNK